MHESVIESLKKSIELKENSRDLARKHFLSYKTRVFEQDEDLEYQIKNKIKLKLKVPFTSIQVIGSSKTGFSFFNRTKFTDGKSDLDVSIISLHLYNNFLEITHGATKGFTDLSTFPKHRDTSTHTQFRKNLQKGFINPFFMPNCKDKSDWLDFFRHLSNEHHRKFKNITGAIYSSEYFFECKQVACIEEFERNIKAYDSLPSKI